ncbi:hypothetical protein V502_04827 [Pseudogymnoascus sp. VKM F-4520 (FW-2644)]|nr:hypothetical protein V502_04827 [Pseudogymnoascus sp. VKM F-4520 (FW-2644)]
MADASLTSLLTAVNLVYDPQGPVLICKACGFALAVSRSQVTSHLWEKHQISSESRQNITSVIRSLQIPNPTGISLRPDQSLSHPYLKVYRGYACHTCDTRTINLDTITRHVSSCRPQPLSRHRKNPDRLYQDVLLQSWVSGASRKYWIVRQVVPLNPPWILSDLVDLEAIHQRERAHIAHNDQQAMQDTGSKDLALTTPWMERTKWAYVYEGVRRDLLVRLSELGPAWIHRRDFVIGEYEGVNLVSTRRDEQKIWRLIVALDRALDRCEETMRHTGHPLLCWLNTIYSHRFYPKPFGFLGRAATRQRYRRLWRRFIAFLFRAYRLTPEVRQSALGVRFTKTQLNQLRQVWEDEALVEVEDVGGPIDNEWEEKWLYYDDSVDSDDDDEEEEEEEGEEDYGEEEEEEGIGGEDDNDYIGQFNEGRDSDDDHDSDKADNEETEKDVRSSEESKEECPSGTNIHEVDKVAELVFRLSVFCCTEVFTNGQPSSSLLVYYSGVLGCTADGSTFRRARDYTPQLSALIYIQRLLLLEWALPYRTYTLIERVEALCDKLMFNWSPDVDLSRVKDDMSNTKEGYSFIQHPANDLATAYLMLSTRACTAQGGRLLKDGKWDTKAVNQYLKMAESIREEVLAMMYAPCGQAPRATEILSIECCNGKSTERGVYVYNGFMIYVIRHQKAKKSTNKEFMVVRFLPAKAGKLLFYYLVYIRPFAAFLQRQTYMCSTRTQSNLLFCSNQEPTRLWRSKRLADILWKSSALVFKRPVNIRLYRQLSICITEKHVKILAKPFNRYDDHSANADPNVVFAWQSGHRPLERGMTYGLDGAFPSQLQPALLNIYEWASVEWHQFLGLQSRINSMRRAITQVLK